MTTKNTYKRTSRTVAIIDPLAVELLPAPRRIRLRNIEEVSRELRRLYNEWRRGELPSQEATRGTFILQALAKILEQSQLEARIVSLEQKADELARSTARR